MQLVILVEDKMMPVPEGIKVMFDWDTISIHASVESKKGFVRGNHMMLEAQPDNFKDWLRPFDGVWVGKGAPQMQNFELSHIK